jgi:hypothetical protein
VFAYRASRIGDDFFARRSIEGLVVSVPGLTPTASNASLKMQRTLSPLQSKLASRGVDNHKLAADILRHQTFRTVRVDQVDRRNLAIASEAQRGLLATVEDGFRFEVDRTLSRKAPVARAIGMMQVKRLLDQRAFPLGAPGGRLGAPTLNFVAGIGEADDEVAVRQRRLGDRQLELIGALAPVGRVVTTCKLVGECFSRGLRNRIEPAIATSHARASPIATCAISSSSANKIWVEARITPFTHTTLAGS